MSNKFSPKHRYIKALQTTKMNFEKLQVDGPITGGLTSVCVGGL